MTAESEMAMVRPRYLRSQDRNITRALVGHDLIYCIATLVLHLKRNSANTSAPLKTLLSILLALMHQPKEGAGKLVTLTSILLSH